MDPVALFSNIRSQLITRARDRCNFVGTEAQLEQYLREQTAVIGYTDPEIDDAQARTGLIFPSAFRAYLKCFGKKCCLLFGGTNFVSLGHLVATRESAQLHLDNLGMRSLIPDDSIVFLEHQGYDWAFIVTSNAVDDPPVYWCNEGGDKILAAESLTQFVISDAGVNTDS